MSGRFVAVSAMVLVAILLPAVVAAQHGPHGAPDITASPLLNITEILTGLAAAVVAFQAARAYREGLLGQGVTWVAVGMVIMAIGHLILVAKRFFGFDPLGFLGLRGSFIAFSIAVFASFLSSAVGFYLIRKAAGPA